LLGEANQRTRFSGFGLAEAAGNGEKLMMDVRHLLDGFLNR
jgi:hypothetical protein